MTTTNGTVDQLTSSLAAHLARHRLPGASVAVLDRGVRTLAAAGIANARTGVPATPDTLFLIGSITKVLTTTLVLQLAEAGQLALDAPVHDYLPDLRLGDEVATAGVTVRHLLTHTNGIPGDHLHETGRGDDAVALYAASLAALPPLHPPGAAFSYSNSGFILAGHLLERLTGQTWHALLRERLLDPLGMDHTRTLPEEVLGYRVAPGHRPGPAGELAVGEMWREFHAGAPAGFTPYATADDLLTFAALHLAAGRTPDGTPLLSPAGVAAMQAPQVTPIPSGPPDLTGWGLGWSLLSYGPARVIGHNGGASAALRILPDQRYAVAVLTNAAGGTRLATDLIAELVRERFGLTVPATVTAPPDEPPTAAPTGAALAAYAGDYAHLGFAARVDVAEGRLWLTTGPGGATPVDQAPLTALTAATFASESSARGPARVGFAAFDPTGRPDIVHIGLRSYHRQATSDAEPGPPA